MTSKTGDAALATERVADVLGQLGWLRNTLVFQATPFERVVREVERDYGVSVTMMDTTLDRLSITATFTDRPLQEVILVLCEIVSTTCSIEGDRVLIGSEVGQTASRAEGR
jgi:ferric-dicitrate binding protein FerR (iron transport regulator)